MSAQTLKLLYNFQHQMYTTMEEETKGTQEKFNAKCVEYEALEMELCRVKESLKNALETIHGQEKVREEAKESQVKCCVLQEQIEVGVSSFLCTLFLPLASFNYPLVSISS